MPSLLLRIDLDERSRDFQRIALQPGFPVLDRFSANSIIVRQWLGPYAPEAAWDEQTVRFLWHGDGDGDDCGEVKPVSLAELNGAFRSDVEELRERLKKAPVRTPAERALLGILQSRLDAELSSGADVPGMFFKTRVRGRWRLAWCWGYERRSSRTPSSMRICRDDACRLAVFDDPETRRACPRCGTKRKSGGFARVLMTCAALLLAAAGGWFAWNHWKPAGSTLEGDIIDAATGKPIANAVIRLPGEPPAETNANAEGAFRLDFAGRAVTKLAVAAPGYQPAEWSPPKNGAGGRQRISLRGDADVSGLVVDEGSDRPVSFPEIRVIGSGRGETGDDAGLFTLTGLASGNVELEVTARGFETARQVKAIRAGPSSDLVIALRGSASARGTVVDAFTKEPVPNAVIRIADRSDEILSDGEGRFSQGGLPGTSCRFDVSAPGFLTREFERPLNPTGETALRFLLRPELTTLAGIVVDSSGTPIAGASVRAAGAPAPAKTSDDGRFVLSGVRHGTARLEIDAKGYRTKKAETAVPAAEGEKKRFVLDGSARLVGQVTDAARKSPVKEAEVRVDNGRWKGVTNEKGEFQIANLPAGTFRVEVVGRGYRADVSEAKLSDGETTLKAELRSGTVLSGVIKSTLDQKPIAGADVRVEGIQELVRTDAEGRFRLEDIVAGVARISVTADGYVPANSEKEIRTDEEITLDLNLRGAAALRGRIVVEGKDEPIASATVTLDGLDRKLTSDERGEFSLEGLPARPLRLKVEANGFSAVEAEQDLAHTDAPPLVVRMKKQHSIEGVVVDARSGQPVAAARVKLTGVAESTVSDENGRFSFQVPEEKSYEFAVAATGYPAQTFVKSTGVLNAAATGAAAGQTPASAKGSQAEPFLLTLDRDSEAPVADKAPPAVDNPERADRPEGDQFVAAPGRPRDAEEVEFFGMRIRAANVGFVVDCSGSMSGTRIERTKLELLKSVLNLHSKQAFYVSFFNDAAIPMFGGASSPIPASPVNKARIYNWMKSVPADGGTVPEPALQLVAGMKPQAIFLLSDGGFDPLSEGTYMQLKNNPTRVNTVAFEDEVGRTTLEEIANRTGGIYRFVPAAPIPEFLELALVTRLYEELLDQWLDPKGAPKEAQQAHEALVEFCQGQDFGPRGNVSEEERSRSRVEWQRWWVEYKLSPALRGKPESQLVQNMKNSSFWWRWAAVEAARLYGMTNGAPYIGRIRDAEPGIRQAARTALVGLAVDEDFGPPEPANSEQVRKAYDDWTDWWRRVKHRATFPAKTDESLVHEFDSPDVRTRRAALQAAAARPRFTQISPLIDRLADSDEQVREAAHRSLVNTAGKDMGAASCVPCWQKWQSERFGKEADRLYREAQSLESHERGDPAIRRYQRIIDDYPETSAAKSAAARLKAINPAGRIVPPTASPNSSAPATRARTPSSGGGSSRGR